VDCAGYRQVLQRVIDIDCTRVWPILTFILGGTRRLLLETTQPQFLVSFESAYNILLHLYYTCYESLRPQTRLQIKYIRRCVLKYITYTYVYIYIYAPPSRNDVTESTVLQCVQPSLFVSIVIQDKDCTILQGVVTLWFFW